MKVFPKICANYESRAVAWSFPAKVAGEFQICQANELGEVRGSRAPLLVISAFK
jgi:hypothetical protein